jgi:hypothetical protein
MSWTTESFRLALAFNPGRHVGLQCLILGGFGIVLFAIAAGDYQRILARPLLRPITYLLGGQQARYLLALLGLALAVISARVWLANRA